MRGIVCCGAAAVVLLGSIAVFAQEPSLKDAQKQSFPAQPGEPAQHSGPPGTTPPPPLSQPQAPIADQAAPAAVGPAQANTTDGAIAATPLGATAQTMPSTISKENAARDKLPTTTMQFPLTDEQKKLIVKSVEAAPKVPANANLADTHVAMFLPIGVPMQVFAGDLTQQLPDAGRYKYVKLNDRVLIVDPPILTVVGEIKL